MPGLPNTSELPRRAQNEAHYFTSFSQAMMPKMKRYVLAMIMLALAAGGVVWVAVNERGNVDANRSVARDRKSPASTGAMTASDAMTETIPDAGPQATFPPLSPYAAWSLVRWDMSMTEVEAALRKEGATIVEATDTKNGAKRLRATSGAWEATIDFGAKGVDEIVVTVGNLSREGADAIVAKMKERAPATRTTEHAERRWKKDTGELATLVTHVDGTTATMREEHARERSPGGAVGFASLRWGMSSQEVVGQLTARGYGAYVAKATDSHAAAVPFTKGDVEGTASFNQFGLRHVELSGPTADRGATRAKELASSLGKPVSVEVSTKTEHVDHARMTSIDVESKERQPGGGFTVVETYRRKR